jgi:hypothetical protein
VRLSSENSSYVISSITWKHFAPFVQSNLDGTQEFGFTLSGFQTHERFYTSSAKELDNWAHYLSALAINTDIEDDFEVLAQIGEGGYSDVYKAKSRVDGEIY